MRLPTETVMTRYQNPLYRAAWAVVQNDADAKDVVQQVMIRYHHGAMNFESEEHLRRWLFACTVNQARDMRRSFWSRNRVSLQDVEAAYRMDDPKDQDLFEAVSALPESYRVVLHLYYFENWTTREIAQIVHTSEACVRKRMSRARRALKEKLTEDWNDDE